MRTKTSTKTIAVMLAIIVLLSANVAFAQEIASGGKPAQGQTPSPTKQSVKKEKECKVDFYIDTTEGSTQWKVLKAGSKAPKGDKWEKIADGITLSKAHIEFMKKHGAERQPKEVDTNYVEFDYGVGVRALTDKGLKILIRDPKTRELTDWEGPPDKITFDEKNRIVKYDGKPIHPTIGRLLGLRYFLDEKGEPTDEYIKFLGGGNVKEVRKETVSFVNKEGLVLASFEKEEYDKKWKGKLAVIDEVSQARIAFAVKDLGLDPDDVKETTKINKLVGEDFIITTDEDKVVVLDGNIVNDELQEGTKTEYSIINGKKRVSSITEKKIINGKSETVSEQTFELDEKGKIKKVIVSEWDEKNKRLEEIVSAVKKKYGDIGTFYELDTVNGVSVVTDGKGNLKYIKNNQELIEDELDKFKKENKKTLEKLEDKAEKIEKAEGTKRLEELSRQERAQFTNFGTFMETFALYFRQYSGMAGWSSLIWDEDFLEDWKEKVNKVMCDALPFLPVGACWESKICGRYSDITPPRKGILYSARASNIPQPAAHVQGRRSVPIETPEGTAWGYTVTFSIKNPLDETLSYNVRFVGEREPTWWSSMQSVPKGQTVSVTGAEALFKISTTNYHTVCLEFSPSIKSFGGKRVSKLCNRFVQQEATPTSPYAEEEEDLEKAAEEEPIPSDQPGGNV